MQQEEFEKLLEVDSENERIEFKKAKNKFDFNHKLLGYCVALSNEGGGQLILGVTNKKPRKAVGTKAFQNLQKTKQDIFNHIQLKVEVEEFYYGKERTIIFTIPSRPTGMAISLKGKYLMRIGEDLHPMDFQTLQKIGKEGRDDFSSKICKGLSSEELNKSAIDQLKQIWTKKLHNEDILDFEDSQVLSDLELCHNGQFNYACLLFVGSKKAISKYLGNAEIVYEWRNREGNIEYQDNVDFKDAFLLYFDDLWQKIQSRNEVFHIREGFLMRDIWSFNKDVIREGVLNAISHRDYNDSGSIYIRQYPNKIEIESPGRFVEGVTAENIIDVRSKPRNRRIHETLKHLGFVDKSGQGADKIFKKTISEGKGMPEYSETESPSLKLTINAVIQDKNFINYLEAVTQKLQIRLSPKELVFLENIRSGKRVNYQSREMDKLVVNKLVERVGRKRKFVLSKKYYIKKGKLPEYSRRKGLAHNTNKELILRFMEENKRRGIMKEFIEVLRDVPKWQINRYLNELKKAEKICLVGNPRIHKGEKKAYWELLQ